jgi:hypothetical protein
MNFAQQTLHILDFPLAGQSMRAATRKRPESQATLFTDDIRAALCPHPNLVNAAGIDINPVTNAVRLPLWLGVCRIRDGELALQDEVRGKASV